MTPIFSEHKRVCKLYNTLLLSQQHTAAWIYASSLQCCRMCTQACSVLQEAGLTTEGTSISADGKTLIKDGVSYQVGDQVYVHPDTFDQLEQAAQAEVPDYAAKGRFHKVSSSTALTSVHVFFVDELLVLAKHAVGVTQISMLAAACAA